jgi:hypothetical protein
MAENGRLARILVRQVEGLKCADSCHRLRSSKLTRYHRSQVEKREAAEDEDLVTSRVTQRYAALPKRWSQTGYLGGSPPNCS